MSIRLFATAVALSGAIALSVTGAEARVHSIDNASLSAAKPTLSKNFKSHGSKRIAKSTKRKPAYTKAKSSKKRYGSKKNKLKSRSFTKYASGGASRSCLQPQARALLNRIESQFGAVSIVSTCRPGAVIATSGKPSKHRYGLAIDFNAGSRKGAIVNWLRANHHSGGTMTYANMSHIHVDIGHRFVSLNAGGRRRG